MAVRNRRAVPAEIVEAPEVSENNALVWLCYWDLRRGSDPETAIRWADVVLWAETYGCSLQQMEGLQVGVLILDNAFLPIMRAKLKAARAVAAKGGK